MPLHDIGRHRTRQNNRRAERSAVYDRANEQGPEAPHLPEEIIKDVAARRQKRRKPKRNVLFGTRRKPKPEWHRSSRNHEEDHENEAGLRIAEPEGIFSHEEVIRRRNCDGRAR